MNYNFDWNYIASGAPYVTISNYALSLMLLPHRC